MCVCVCVYMYACICKVNHLLKYMYFGWFSFFLTRSVYLYPVCHLFYNQPCMFTCGSSMIHRTHETKVLFRAAYATTQRMNGFYDDV